LAAVLVVEVLRVLAVLRSIWGSSLPGVAGGNGSTSLSGDNPGRGGVGGDGGGGAGLGGAIFVNSGANLALINSNFDSNTANGGGNGGSDAGIGQGRGGAIFVRDGGSAAQRVRVLQATHLLRLTRIPLVRLAR
ncbi:MAG: hypothetical protein HC894_21160, partial [Microcoleus sp. SM1_3_4]|nr:hypothetical protein [Microcoleus sp. SM1_3_4]